MAQGDRPFDEVRRDLDALGFRPSRVRGQNFLLDPNLLDAIVRDAAIEADETVVEIGAGPGTLTQRLACAAARVVAFEIDPRLVEAASRRLSALGNLELVTGDALGGSKRGLHPRLCQVLSESRAAVVANLPYRIAAPLLANLLEHNPPPCRLVVMVQKEVANRILARPGTPAYGPLTIAIRARAEGARLRDVPREVFRPRPNVDSTILRLVPRADRPGPEEGERLRRLIALAFRARRKKLAPQWAPFFGGVRGAEAAMAALGVSPLARAEDLPVEAFRELARGTHPR